MLVVVKRPMNLCELHDVDDNLQTWQGLVGGYIEVVPFEQDTNILIIVNEEGKFNNSKPNFIWYGDMIMGTAVFVGNNVPEFRGLTRTEIKHILNVFGQTIK